MDGCAMERIRKGGRLPGYPPEAARPDVARPLRASPSRTLIPLRCLTSDMTITQQQLKFDCFSLFFLINFPSNSSLIQWYLLNSVLPYSATTSQINNNGSPEGQIRKEQDRN